MLATQHVFRQTVIRLSGGNSRHRIDYTRFGFVFSERIPEIIRFVFIVVIDVRDQLLSR